MDLVFSGEGETMLTQIPVEFSLAFSRDQRKIVIGNYDNIRELARAEHHYRSYLFEEQPKFYLAGEIFLQKPDPSWSLFAYSDLGPTGICGQCCSITCPWVVINYFPEGQPSGSHRRGRRTWTLEGKVSDIIDWRRS